MTFLNGFVNSMAEPAVMLLKLLIAPRATLPLGQCNLASGRHLIYKQSNLIFSVWTDCNLVLERNPSKSFVVLAAITWFKLPYLWALALTHTWQIYILFLFRCYFKSALG